MGAAFRTRSCCIHKRERDDESKKSHHAVVSRFRSSPTVAAGSAANFGFGALETDPNSKQLARRRGGDLADDHPVAGAHRPAENGGVARVLLAQPHHDALTLTVFANHPDRGGLAVRHLALLDSNGLAG